MPQAPKSDTGTDLDDVPGLLDRIGVLTHPCDLDLLVFFARHPYSLLSNESLASLVGCGLEEVTESLDTLLAAKLLTRTATSTHAARMYVFGSEGSTHGWLPSLLKIASTRGGRLTLREGLSRRARDPTSPQRTTLE